MASDVTVIIKSRGANEVVRELDHVGDAAEKSGGRVGKLGGALTDIGKIAGGIVLAKAFDAGTSAIKGAFSAAIDFQKMQAATAAVIESTGGKAGITAKAVTDLANSLERTTAIDDQVIQGAQNLLLTFTNIGKDVFPTATKAVLNMSTALGTDANGAAIQLGKALNDPIKGITALSRVGVSFTEAQKASIKAMVEMGDVAGAQKLILAELETEFGGAAEAAGKTFGGQLSLLKDTISDTFRDLAVKALPTLLKLTTVFATVLPKAIDVAGMAIGKVVTFLTPAATALTGLAETAGRFAWDKLKAFGDYAWSKVSGPLGTVAGAVKEISEKVGGFVWDKLQDFGGFVADTVYPALKEAAKWALELYIAFLKWEYGQFAEFGAFVQETVWPALQKAAQYAGELGEKLGAFAWDGIKTFGDWANENLVPALEKAAEKARSFGDDLVDPKEDVKAGWASFLDGLSAGWEKVRTAVQPAVDALRPFAERILPAMKDAFAPLLPAFAELGGALKELGAAFKPLLPVFEALKPLVEPLAKVIGGVLVVALAALLLALEGIIRVIGAVLVGQIKILTTAIQVATPIIETINTAFAGVVTFITTKVVPVFATLIGAIGTFATDVGTKAADLLAAGKKLFQGLYDGILEIWRNTATWLTGIGGYITGAIGDLSRLLWNIGSSIIEGLWNGMKSMWKSVEEWLGGLGGKIGELKGPLEKDRVLLEPQGMAIMEGFGVGLAKGWSKSVVPVLAGATAALAGGLGGAQWTPAGGGFNPAQWQVSSALPGSPRYPGGQGPVLSGLDIGAITRQVGRGMLDIGSLPPDIQAQVRWQQGGTAAAASPMVAGGITVNVYASGYIQDVNALVDDIDRELRRRTA